MKSRDKVLNLHETTFQKIAKIAYLETKTVFKQWHIQQVGSSCTYPSEHYWPSYIISDWLIS